MTTTFSYEFLSNMAIPGVGDNATCRAIIRSGFERLVAICDTKFVEKSGGTIKLYAGDARLNGRQVLGLAHYQQNTIQFSNRLPWPEPRDRQLMHAAQHEMEHIILRSDTINHLRDGESGASMQARVNAELVRRFGPPQGQPMPTPTPTPTPTPAPNPDPPDKPAAGLMPSFVLSAKDFTWGPTKDRVAPVRDTGAAYVHSADSYIERAIPGDIREIVILACGQPHNGWPVMEVFQDNKHFVNVMVNSAAYKAYKFTLPKPGGVLRIGMVADSFGGPRNDRNLVVYGVGWDKQPDPPEPEPVLFEATVEFLQGTNSARIRLNDGREFGAVLSPIQ